MQPKRLSPKLKIYSTKQKPRGRSRRSPMQLLALRLADLGTLFRSRYHGEQLLPDDDSGRDDLVIALNHLACLPHPQRPLDAWIAAWAPWLTAGEHAELVPPILMRPQRWKADALAWRLRVTPAERAALGLTTIGAMGETSAQRAKRRRLRAIERKRATRKAEGATPRKAYERNALTSQKPWKLEGISRRTWYRRRATTDGTGPATP